MLGDGQTLQERQLGPGRIGFGDARSTPDNLGNLEVDTRLELGRRADDFTSPVALDEAQRRVVAELLRNGETLRDRQIVEGRITGRFRHRAPVDRRVLIVRRLAL